MLFRFKDLVENGIVNNRVTLKRAIELHGFPKPIALGPNTIAWRRSEVEEWIESRPREAARRK
jgi:predicted DNA-binding transcriptional regulator AlpA